ncbi:conserved Plasmodium protein, unknown function [Plasmodium knowlesi strain H]|uniref:EMP1-trafficking protein n=3 Tax=Plasmodium knowlesi TaxID=5850 RepID=A0A5K1V1X4_PLAKH|nr:conserved Plasmodium protein, unknown function [Plasmodium knowlesi strain H]OTN64296.1 Uncharacterized protein PKNOH_S140266700 [Plasmodium knowlesi]CAA9991081.1 conserved Plasmodium protein, unknown function [Plasmodium knowlesi strain H]SBO20624.1 conserved Plasmodium protein, unknown function [Plasmodium knowlesi strain H]SBO21032.1 conserved Plasmodium protein, unknown function [Plasmodium knowlesi strain H]VVS80555.1 conserved Plasmodium protein, unknown function [Plasmodium knowlesi |eukprot:XP_002262363.1 hypothetical protein, conserved in Plasmodium species [Plasmodium knowlesi strain H]
MKLQYHLLLFTFLLSENVLCHKSISENVKDGSAVRNQGGCVGSENLTHGGKKALWAWGGNDKKGEGNKSSNREQGLMSSVVGSVKRMLFFNDKEIENHVQGISDNVQEMKDGMIKNSSNIVKHASKIKDELQKNTAYWANVVKTTVSEELHQIDQFSKDQLDKLRKNPENKFFFTKLFSAGSAAADTSSPHKDKENKNGGEGGVLLKGPNGHNDPQVEKEQKDKSFWDLMHTRGRNASSTPDGKEPSKGFLRMFKGDTTEPSNSAEKKEPSFSWFGMQSSENGVLNGKNSPEAKSVNGTKGQEVKKKSFLSHFTSESNEEGNLPKGSATQQNNANDDTEKNHTFSFNFFKKKENNEEFSSGPISEEDEQQNDSQPNVKRTFFQWFNSPPKGEKDDEHLSNKEHSGGMTQDSLKGSQHGEANEQGEENKSPFSVFNMWKGPHKEKEEKQKEEVETDIESKASEVTDGDSSEKNKNGKSFFFNPFGGLKSEGESSHTEVTNPGETTNAEGIAHSELNRRSGFLVDIMKNIYDGKSDETGEKAEKILSFIHTEHEHDVNTNCHPLVSFKTCLSTCFNVPPAVEGENNDGPNEKKKNLSVGDYKKLEKCISTCRNRNFNEQTPGCATKDGSVITNNKINYEEKLKNLENSNYTWEQQSSVFTDLTLRDKYSDEEEKQAVKIPNGEMLSGNSTWMMDASGKHLSVAQREEKSGSDKIPTLSDSPLGTHLYSMDTGNSSMGVHKRESTDGKNTMVGENSFSFFKGFAPQTGSTSDVVNTLGATKPLHEPHGKNKASTDGAVAKLNSEMGTHGEDLERAQGRSGDNNDDNDDDDDDEEEDMNIFRYISKGFFLLLLLLTFFVYLSAFTNIITQFYVSFKEKVCLYIKGHCTSPFHQPHAESTQAFLTKESQHSYATPLHSSYDNLYHAFHDNTCDVA